jgi:hypothetical protein
VLDPQDGTRDYDAERYERRNRVPTVARRRTSREDEPDEAREERPTRGRRSRDAEPDEETPRRGRRSRDDDDAGEDRPRRGRSARGRSRDDDEPDEDRPRRGRRSRSDSDEAVRGGRRGRSATRGFGAYSSKKRSGNYADEFKPGHNKPTLIKHMEDGPFDTYNLHWLDDMGKGERKSYVCLDDDYFGPEGKRDECPLCAIGDTPRTIALFNILNLSDPRKPEVQVWAAPPTVADTFERAANEKKTSPLNREDVYFEVELVKSKSKYTWSIVPVKGRDLQEDFDIEPFDADELEEFSKDLFEDRTAVTKVDDYDTLAEIADDLD